MVSSNLYWIEINYIYRIGYCHESCLYVWRHGTELMMMRLLWRHRKLVSLSANIYSPPLKWKLEMKYKHRKAVNAQLDNLEWSNHNIAQTPWYFLEQKQKNGGKVVSGQRLQINFSIFQAGATRRRRGSAITSRPVGLAKEDNRLVCWGVSWERQNKLEAPSSGPSGKTCWELNSICYLQVLEGTSEHSRILLGSG